MRAVDFSYLDLWDDQSWAFRLPTLPYSLLDVAELSPYGLLVDTDVVGLGDGIFQHLPRLISGSLDRLLLPSFSFPMPTPGWVSASPLPRIGEHVLPWTPLVHRCKYEMIRLRDFLGALLQDNDGDFTGRVAQELFTLYYGRLQMGLAELFVQWRITDLAIASGLRDRASLRSLHAGHGRAN